MSDLLRRAADAIRLLDPCDFFEAESKDYVGMVRAVLTAIREPSEAMAHEGAGVIPCAQGVEEGPENIDGARNCWRVMIDALLASE
jgi:hypothetical protein